MSGDRNVTESGELRGLRPVPPPSGLRGPVLLAAREALARRNEAPDVWTRIVNSRVARVAWVAAVVGLVAAHLAISLPRRTAAPRHAVAPILASTVEPGLAEHVRMSRIDPRAERGIVAEFAGPSEENGS